MTFCSFNERGYCITHQPPNPKDRMIPALCTHAAAELERRMEVAYQMVAKAESDVATLSKRLARLEEKKAQQVARSQENERSMVKAWDEIDLLKDRLAQAEAREAAMRGALEANLAIVKKAWADYNWPLPSEAFGPEGAIAMGEAALSPNAGRALAEVEKLREAQTLYRELLYAVGNKYDGETRHQTALRYIQERERASCDTIAKMGEEGGK